MGKRESLHVCAAIVVVLAAGLACKKRGAVVDAGDFGTVPTTGPIATETATATAPTATATATTTATGATVGATAKSTFKIGDSINVRWQGQVYPATVLAVLPGDKYKIHYTGWASSWDETVGLDRIVGAKGGAAATTGTAKSTGGGGGGGGKTGGGAAADAPCPGPGITRRCNGVCVNLQTDDRNCGSCGTVCPSGKHCDGHLFCRDAEGNL